MPKVSVVIPTYNRAKFLSETIESVLAQTFQDFEVIVVDDGSVDNTREVVSGFPVQYIYQENQGAPAAYNRGIASAKGEYIAFIDSDDVLLKDAMRKQVEILDKHPEAGFSYGQYYVMNQSGDVRGLMKVPWENSGVRDGKEEISALIFRNHICPHTVVRRRCLEEVGIFNPAFRHGSVDYELWVRLAKRYHVAYLSEPVMKYRAHPATITGQRSAKETEISRSAILESIFNDNEIGPLLSPLRPQAYFHLYYNLAEETYLHRQMTEVRSYLLRAMKVCPGSFFKSMWLDWIYLFIRTWIPLPILTLVKRCKAAMWRKLQHLQTNDKRGEHALNLE